MGYSFRLTARVLLYAPSHVLCYTSRGALAGTRNSSMGPPHEGLIRRPIARWANTLTTELHLAPGKTVGHAWPLTFLCIWSLNFKNSLNIWHQQIMFKGIRFGMNGFVVHLSVMQNQYWHKRRIVHAKTLITQKIETGVLASMTISE